MKIAHIILLLLIAFAGIVYPLAWSLLTGSLARYTVSAEASGEKGVGYGSPGSYGPPDRILRVPYSVATLKLHELLDRELLLEEPNAAPLPLAENFELGAGIVGAGFHSERLLFVNMSLARRLLDYVYMARALRALQSETLNASTYREDLPPEPLQVEYRPPIVIRSDADFTPENGVRSGSGTPDDPYIISGWHINVSDAIRSGLSAAIWIANTTACFVIESCVIDASDYDYLGTGILLENVTCGEIRDVRIDRMYVHPGITICSSSDINLTSCSITRCTTGVKVDNSYRVYISSLYYRGVFRPRQDYERRWVGTGVRVAASRTVAVADSRFSSIQYGVNAVDVFDLLVSNVTVSGWSDVYGYFHGVAVRVYNGTAVTIERLNVDSCRRGLYVRTCRNVLINASSVGDASDDGIYVMDSEDIRVLNVTIVPKNVPFVAAGLDVVFSKNVTIARAYMDGAVYGVVLLGGSKFTIRDSQICNAWYCGIYAIYAACISSENLTVDSACQQAFSAYVFGGLLFYSVANLSVTDTRVTNCNGPGTRAYITSVFLQGCQDVYIADNYFSNSRDHELYLYDCKRVTIVNNYLEGKRGILLYSCELCTVQHNLLNCTYCFGLMGSSLQHFNNTIDETNYNPETGCAVRFIRSVSGATIVVDNACSLILYNVSSSVLQIPDGELSGGIVGVAIGNCSGLTITGVIRNSETGLFAVEATNLQFSGEVYGFSQYGLYAYSCANSSVESCLFNGSGFGVLFYYCDNLTLNSSTVVSTAGVYLAYSAYCSVVNVTLTCTHGFGVLGSEADHFFHVISNVTNPLLNRRVYYLRGSGQLVFDKTDALCLIAVDYSTVVVTEASISNGITGVSVYGPTNITIQNSVIMSQRYAIFAGSSPTFIRISNTKIRDIALYVLDQDFGGEGTVEVLNSVIADVAISGFLLFNLDELTVEDSKFSNITYDAWGDYWFAAVLAWTINYIHIRNTTFSECFGPDIPTALYVGVFIYDVGTYGELSNITIYSNPPDWIYGVGECQVLLYRAPGVRVKNSVFNRGQIPLYIYDSYHITVQNCVFLGGGFLKTATGCFVYRSEGFMRIKDCRFEDVCYGGIYIERSYGCYCQNCTVSNGYVCSYEVVDSYSITLVNCSADAPQIYAGFLVITTGTYMQEIQLYNCTVRNQVAGLQIGAFGMQASGGGSLENIVIEDCAVADVNGYSVAIAARAVQSNAIVSGVTVNNLTVSNADFIYVSVEGLNYQATVQQLRFYDLNFDVGDQRTVISLSAVYDIPEGVWSDSTISRVRVEDCRFVSSAIVSSEGILAYAFGSRATIRSVRIQNCSFVAGGTMDPLSVVVENRS
ncbi:right-handed parallel beta-helix repeat-containing protein, partial [archaeon]|nr:right-handed parallel beta-helix repeat-containing protein [archaeon]